MTKQDQTKTESQRNIINSTNKFEENNAYYDITGNMNIWRVHETYVGTGNDLVWDEILKTKRGKSNANPSRK
jgi:hypothetical protein